MKTEVNKGAQTAHLKAKLEDAARREGTSVSALLVRVTSDWLAEHRNGPSDDDAERAATRKAVIATVCISRRNDETAPTRTRRLIREIITHNTHNVANVFS